MSQARTKYVLWNGPQDIHMKLCPAVPQEYNCLQLIKYIGFNADKSLGFLTHFMEWTLLHGSQSGEWMVL